MSWDPTLAPPTTTRQADTGWFDASRPHPARLYDFWLGGKDHFAADRRAGERIAQQAPWVVAGARANRAFLRRAVAHLARLGVDQYLDVGAGLPTAANVHQIAGMLRPGSRVAYLDNDPIVLALAPGSFIVITHVADLPDAGQPTGRAEATRKAADLYTDLTAPSPCAPPTRSPTCSPGSTCSPPASSASTSGTHPEAVRCRRSRSWAESAPFLHPRAAPGTVPGATSDRPQPAHSIAGDCSEHGTPPNDRAPSASRRARAFR